MIYNNFTDRIKSTLSKNREGQFQPFFKANFTGLSHDLKKDLIKEQINFSQQTKLHLEPINDILNTENPALQIAKLGIHPDFAHLKNSDDTEKHYIVSVFIDIKGSTNLFKEYEHEIIYVITNTIQTAAIQTCIALGGHVQRLQGDGVFAYFGGKDITNEKAVHSALTACSMFSYFVKNDLKNIFEEDGIEDIKTRIGIDFGYDKDVLWANFGILGVSELTTLSLHTSLASKMQSYAKSNGIVIGQNVKDIAKLNERLLDFVRNSKGEVEKRYIFENSKKNFYYTQFEFDWSQYLLSLPNIEIDKNGNLFFRPRNMKPTSLIDDLRTKAILVNTGNAFLGKSGDISNNPSGVPHQKHSFHYE